MSGLSIFAIGEYGASLFLGTPLVMGVVGGYIHNRKHVRPMTDTIIVALTSMGLTALGFIIAVIACLLIFNLYGRLKEANARKLCVVEGDEGVIAAR